MCVYGKTNTVFPFYVNLLRGGKGGDNSPGSYDHHSDGGFDNDSPGGCDFDDHDDGGCDDGGCDDD